MRQQSIAFNSKSYTLEGIITIPNGNSKKFPAVLVGHPHPIFGGSMSSMVLQLISRTLDSSGIATMRFNFRGTGNSQGSFDQGKGEQDDLKAAWNVLRQWPGIDKNRLGLMGISFSSSVALGCIDKIKGISGLCIVSPPENSILKANLNKIKYPSLVLTGSKDKVSKWDSVQEALNNMSPKTQLQVIENADHNWTHKENELASIVSQFFTDSIIG
tara:strand:- start:141 stop:785 length:645 start_codon:yes stop_codon:yes gene_type:complete